MCVYLRTITSVEPRDGVAGTSLSSLVRNICLIKLGPERLGESSIRDLCIRLDEDEEKKFPLGFYVNRKMAEFEDLVKVDAYVRRGLLFNSPNQIEVRGYSSDE